MASRRTYDVWSPEYSAAALPSSARAAPAKNETLSTVPGTSKPVASRIGLPVCRDSVRARSSARSSRSAASRVSAADRSTGGAADHSGNAARAAHDRGVDVGRSREGHLLDGLTGRRVGDVEGLPRPAAAAAPGDELVHAGGS